MSGTESRAGCRGGGQQKVVSVMELDLELWLRQHEATNTDRLINIKVERLWWRKLLQRNIDRLSMKNRMKMNK